METLDTLKTIALSFTNTSEAAHFDKIAFKVNNKIFVTYDAKHNRATVKLNEIDQEVFSTTNKGIIFPVENKWGKQGWTIVDLNRVHTEVFNDIIKTAYQTVAPKKRLRK